MCKNTSTGIACNERHTEEPGIVAVVAIPYDDEKVLFVNQPCIGSDPPDYITDIPYGFVKTGETPEDAAQRVLLEKTGCSLTKPVKLPLKSLGYFFADPVHSNIKTHLFLALDVEQTCNLDPCKTECFAVSTLYVRHMLKHGEFKSATTIVALHRAINIITNHLYNRYFE